MGHLHRLYARRAPKVWQVESRLMQRLGLVKPPSAVQWISTTACDLSCGHCYSEAGHRSPEELSTDEARRLILDELVALGCGELVLAGGEATLRPDFDALVRAAADRGLSWSLHTHGAHVPRHIELLRQHPPTVVAVSVDGPQAHHDDFRGRAGSFQEAIEAVGLLVDAGCPEVVVGTTVTRRNADLLQDLFPAVVASGAHGWGLHLFAPEGRGAEHRQLLPSSDQLRRVTRFARRKRRVFRVELDNEWGSAGAHDAFFRDSPFLCGAGRFVCVVTATGEVVPCTTTDIRESAGNVRDRRLRDIWAEGFGEFRRFQGGCGDGLECWLQHRNDTPVRQHAFGGGA